MSEAVKGRGKKKDENGSMTIIVNAREKTWDKSEVSYEEAVVMAFDGYSEDEGVVYTVTYSKAGGVRKQGSLVKGKSVKVKEGTVFNVTQTNRS